MFIGFPTRKTGMCAMVHVPVSCVAKVAGQIFFWTRGIEVC